MTNEKVDVVIVGAGASGSVYASVMAKAGKKVVLLEQGPDWELSDLISSEIWGRRIKPAGPPILLDGKNPMGYVAQAGWGSGGASLHYFANFPRLLPTDFRMKSEHGRGHDWPIAYEDVAPFFDKVAREIGVSGDAKAEERWRPAGEAYPMPPMKTFRNGDIWIKPLEASGIPMVPAPVGMNSVEFKGRPACLYDGWCHVGCPIGALANPQVTYLGDARKAGAELRAFSTVTRVLTNQAGTRVTGVEYYDDKHQKQIQEASVVLLASWSAQNPRLLLNSATDKHPKGLSNASGLVGHFMMSHHVASTWALFDEDVQNHMGTIAVQYMSYQHYPKTSQKRCVRQLVLDGRVCAEDDRSRQFAGRSLRHRSGRLHEARGAQSHRHQGVRRGTAGDGKSRRTGEREKTNSACRSANSPTRSRTTRSRCGMPIWKNGLKVAKAAGAKGSVVGARRDSDQPSAWRHHHGHRCRPIRSSTASARATKSRTSGLRGRASSRPKGRQIRPLRSSPFRSAAPSGWSRNGGR